MKVNWIEIENIKSFKDATRITLNNDNNFVVGTNGSGKTTLLQVLSTALMILVPQYRAEMQANGPVKKVKLTQSPYNVNLPKNFKRPADDQRVVIELSLEDSSSGLIDEIKQYKDIFTQNSDYITENFWEQEDILTETNRVLTVLQSHTNFVFKFYFHVIDDRLSLDSPSIEANRVIYDAFQLIEKQRLVYNQLYRVGKTLETVDKGFRVVYLGADRVPSFPREIPLGRGNIDDYITNTSYNRNTEIFANIYSTGSFDYIGQSLARIAEEYLYLRWSKLEANPLDHIQEFKDIAATIQKCLDLELTATNPSLPVEPIVFEFVRDGHKMQFEQLSSGEKSLIYFVFTLANPATRNSFIIIDEAEIHLHGNMQDELLSILFSKKEFNNQHFVSTHSPKLINGLTISSVLSVTLYI